MILLVGAGGHARACIDVIEQAGIFQVGGLVGLPDEVGNSELGYPIVAVALEATVIEKHLTIDRKLPGPDHEASLEPDEFNRMVSATRNIEQAMGDGIKRLSSSVVKNTVIARESIVAARAIRMGEVFDETNLTVKRPSTGISPMLWDELLGRRASCDYSAHELIEH